MILHDTNILSTFAKINRLDLLFRIFNRQTLELSENVAAEIRLGVEQGYAELQRVRDLIENLRSAITFKVIRVGEAKQLLYSQIPFYVQSPQRHLKGEMDTIALAWTHNATVVCNERKVYNFCRNNPYQSISVLKLEDLLRSLQILGLMNEKDLLELIRQIEASDRVIVNRAEVFDT